MIAELLEHYPQRLALQSERQIEFCNDLADAVVAHVKTLLLTLWGKIMISQQLKEATENIEQDRINFYMGKHISEVRNLSDIERFKFFDGQQLYAERCKAMLKAAVTQE